MLQFFEQPALVDLGPIKVVIEQPPLGHKVAIDDPSFFTELFAYPIQMAGFIVTVPNPAPSQNFPIKEEVFEFPDDINPFCQGGPVP